MINDIKLALFLGIKSIKRGNKATLGLIVFILALAFINQIFISSVLSGITDTVNKQIVNNVVSNIVISPQEEPTAKDYISHAAEISDQARAVPGVIAVARHYKLAGVFAYDKENNGKFKLLSSQIIGIDPEMERKMNGAASKIISGEYLETPGTGEIILGASLAGGYVLDSEGENLGGVKVGDTVKVTFSNGIMRDYKVKGIYSAKFDMVDTTAFITSREAESILSVYDSASQILVKIDGIGGEEAYIERLQSIFPNLKVKNWREYAGSITNISDSFDIITLIISIIGIAVAAITIFILIYINVVNKRRQIGILKAIGIKKRIIVGAYIFQAFFYAVLGVTAGLAMIFYIVYPYFDSYPLELPMGDTRLVLDGMFVFYSVVCFVAAALVAGFIPSWQTAKEDILKAIWGV